MADKDLVTDPHNAEHFPFEGAKESSPKPEQAPSNGDRRPTDIAVQDGKLVAQTSSELFRIANALLKSHALPHQFQTVEQVAMGMQFLRQLNLPDIVCLRQLAIINGSFSIWGELPKALVERSGELEEFEEFFFLDDYAQLSFENKNLKATPWGAYCMVKRKNRKPVVRTFTVEDAKLAGLWANPKREPWVKYPKRMLQMKARSWAIKDGFADVLMGAAILEYDHDTLPGDLKIVGGSTVADELNAEFLGDKSDAG